MNPHTNYSSMRVFFVASLLFIWKLWFGVVESFIGIGQSMSEGVSASNDKQNEDDKRIRQMYQALLLRRQQCSYWSIIEFPYLAEIVRHDSSYLRRILTTVFIDHPALAQYLRLIACREVSIKMPQCQKPESKQCLYKCEMLPVGFERSLWLIYKRQVEVSNVWSMEPPSEELPLLECSQFIHKITGVGPTS